MNHMIMEITTATRKECAQKMDEMIASVYCAINSAEERFARSLVADDFSRAQLRAFSAGLKKLCAMADRVEKSRDFRATTSHALVLARSLMFDMGRFLATAKK